VEEHAFGVHHLAPLVDLLRGMSMWDGQGFEQLAVDRGGERQLRLLARMSKTTASRWMPIGPHVGRAVAEAARCAGRTGTVPARAASGLHFKGRPETDRRRAVGEAAVVDQATMCIRHHARRAAERANVYCVIAPRGRAGVKQPE